MGTVVDFPYERVRLDFEPPADGVCNILVLPVVRVERCEVELPLMSPDTDRRVQAFLDRLRDPI